MKKPLTIEIHGTGTHNRGAELMAIAIAERLRRTFPDVRLVVPPTYTFGPFLSRAPYCFLTTWPEQGLRARALARLAPDWLASLGGFVSSAEVDVVLDASGFAFSDQWGPQGATSLLQKMNTPGRRRQPLILLPQALGPFEQPAVAEAARRLFARAALVCARDTVSHEATAPLCPPDRLRLYPDFTIGVTPQLPGDVELPPQFCALVPNYRMLDKTGQGEGYVRFLRRAIQLLRERGLDPVIVLHDSHEDRRVLEHLGAEAADVPVLEHPDPRVLKGLLGRATFVIGSRFHALVGSLSQAVPCLGAGWSHKYPELFRDFGCGELLLPDLDDAVAFEERLAQLADPAQRAPLRARIREAGNRLKQRTLQLWEEVEGVIRRGSPQP